MFLLYNAIKTNNIDLLQKLINNQNFKINDYIKTDTDKYIPLHLAVIYNNIEADKLLLDSNANINAIDYDDWTALHFACSHGHL